MWWLKISKFQWRLFMILVLCATIISGTGYWFVKKTSYGPITFKTNSLQKIMQTKEHILGNLWHSMNIYFWNKYLPTWQQGIKPTPAQKKEQKLLFHYNLGIEHIVDNTPAMRINHKRPTIYFHGWGDTKNSAKLFKAYADVLPGDIITFNFRDRGVIIPKLHHSNLGQLPDVLSGLYVLKWTKEMVGVEAFDLYGYSRGGATILNLIAVLNDTHGTYDQELARIGITPTERATLLSLIQKGTIVLDCPLTDMNVSVKERMKRITSHAINALKRITRYQPDGLQGLTSSICFGGLKLAILVHFQNHDTIVSNKNEAQLYLHLYNTNPRTTFVVLGNDGGHLHTHASLARSIHTFKRMFGGSYDPEYDTQYRTPTQNQWEAQLLTPGPTIEQVLSTYYGECKRLGRS